MSDKKYRCPEPGCNRSFDKPQGLGSHRARVHGYRTNGGTVEPPEADLQADLLVETRETEGRKSSEVRHPFDSDAVLQEVFPHGVPAQTSVVRRTSELLREAYELHKLAVGDTTLV